MKAVCSQPFTLPVTNLLTCESDISLADLLLKASRDNKVAAFRNVPSATVPAGPTSTVYTIQPAPLAGDFVFPGGQTTTITLTATTPTGPPSVDSCVTTVTVPLKKPSVICTPALTLPATSGCAAHPLVTDLTALINAGSDPGSGGPLNLALNPAAPASGVYTLPLGTYPITLTVSNCAGTATCSTLVTIADQEALQVCAPRLPAVHI